MSDVVARFKHHLWMRYAIDPQAVAVTVGANGKVQSFGVNGDSSMTRAMAFGSGAHAGKDPTRPLTVEFEGGQVRQTEYDGAGGPVAGMTIR